MGESFSNFGIIAGIIAVILNVILFFKVWGMTNDVAKIARILERKESSKTGESSSYDISVGDKVYIKSKKKSSRVVSIRHGLYECEGDTIDGWIERGDLEKV
jgi:hypothetical protein